MANNDERPTYLENDDGHNHVTYMSNNNSNNNHPNFVKNFVLSILMTLCCNTIAGILAIIFNLQANNAFLNNNEPEYLRYSNYTNKALIIGLIIAVAIIGGYVLIFGASFLAAITTAMQ